MAVVAYYLNNFHLVSRKEEKPGGEISMSMNFHSSIRYIFIEKFM